MLKPHPTTVRDAAVKENTLIYIKGDKELSELICQKLTNSQFNNFNNTGCILEEKKDQKDPRNIYSLEARTVIKSSSNDYWRNFGYSLATLTLGIFITVSGEIEYSFVLTDGKTKKEIFNIKIDSFGRTGMWGVLPIYGGFVATNLGTALGTYRKPENTKKFCMEEKVSKLRSAFESSREEYCAEYKLFLEDSFNQIEQELINLLNDNIIVWEKGKDWYLQ